MTPNTSKTVLFVFSFSAALEAERKPLFGSKKKGVSKHFFKFLNKKTLSLAKQSGLDFVFIDETLQEGNSFGERYFNAFKLLFNKGYEKVISVGNDTPNLTVAHIEQAKQSLDNQELVFGPSKDGGVYLLGYTKSAFNENAFKNFSWLTSNLSKEIENFAIQESITFSALESLQDIDSRSNALEYAYANLNSFISSFILFYSKINKAKYQDTSIVPPRLFSINSFLLRGPPFA